MSWGTGESGHQTHHVEQMAEMDAASPKSSDDIKTKKTRASKPKVKTGCQTCKIRRVKCDETKPSCLRCVRFGHQCDGYTTNKCPTKPGTTIPLRQSRVLVPKSSSSGSPISPISAISTFKSSSNPSSPIAPISESYRRSASYLSPAPTLYPSPAPMILQLPNEYQAFLTFINRTSPSLLSPLSTKLLNQLIITACSNSPEIRRSVLAIGSLPLNHPYISSRHGNTVSTLQHHFAYRKYSESLCLLRRDVAGSFCDLRSTVMACLLFYTFSNQDCPAGPERQGEVERIYDDLNLVREWAESITKPGLHQQHGAFPTGSEDPAVFREGIFRALQILELQVMTYADERTREAHLGYKNLCQRTVDSIPSMFSSLPQAKEVLEVVIRRSMHWLRSTMQLQNFSTPSSTPGSSPTNSSIDEDEGGELFFDVDPPFEEKEETLKEYERWDNAFRPLLNHSRSKNAPHEEFLQASTLRLHWLAGYMSIKSNNSHSSLVNDGRFKTELEELVDIARILLDHGERGGEGWEFDTQIIVPLMTVAWIYRHRALRKEAINLLLRSPRTLHQDIRDGAVVGKIMDWLAKVEEDGLDTENEDVDMDRRRASCVSMGGVRGKGRGEYVPEWATARCIKMSFDTGRREASVSCLQPGRGSLVGKEVKRETVFAW